MSDCEHVKTKLNFDSTKESCNDEPYKKLIGLLTSLAVLTSPDIAYSVNFLSQFNNYLIVEHWKSAKLISRYKDHCSIFTSVKRN